MSLGQSFPITTWGINVDLKYKGFGLYMLGTLHTGILNYVQTLIIGIMV